MGPVGILCVQRTLEKGRKTGFFTGIGAAISDIFYCLLTGFGLSFIEDFLERNQNIIQLFGSVVLIGFGIYLFRSNPTRKLKKPEENRISARKNILNGFLFTVSNPLIIFLIIGLFARFNFMGPNLPWYTYIAGFISIAAGALIWWYIVSFFVDKVRSHFNLRSMWLINKIIGSLVLLFALVGIVSSVSALASATPRKPLYLNSRRGFSPLSSTDDKSPLTIRAPGPDTVYRLLDLQRAEAFSLSFRAGNLNNESGKRYTVLLPNGSKGKIAHPGWGVILRDSSGSKHIFSFRTSDPNRDETYFSPALTVTYTGPGDTLSRTLHGGIDLYRGPNSYRLTLARGFMTLMAGNHDNKPILSEIRFENPIDSIGFIVFPGAMLTADWISLEFPPSPGDIEPTRFENSDVINTYLNRSTDPIEGIWRLFDRTLDEDKIRPGGDYRLLLVSSAEGYDLIYLSGATINRTLWKQGMIKAKLRSTGFKDIYDVEWIDATGVPLSTGVKAQFDSGMLTIHFPYQDSSLRLRRLKRRLNQIPSRQMYDE